MFGINTSSYFIGFIPNGYITTKIFSSRSPKPKKKERKVNYIEIRDSVR